MTEALVDASRLVRSGIRVLGQSASDLVVVKPAGMASELTSDPKWSSLISKVRQSCAEGVRPRLVHRLDRITSGVMLIALTKDAAAFYGEQIREGMWEKLYLARIPEPDPERNVLHRDLLGRHKAHIREVGTRATIVNAGGRPSFLEILEVEPAPGMPGQSHALIRLLTGRLHQIRVMMAGLGLALVGDEPYGGRTGSTYLEHVLLRYVEFETREVATAFCESSPDRERVGRRLWDRLNREAERRTLS